MKEEIKVAISTSSFGQADRTALNILYAAGIEVVDNPHKRKLTEPEIIQHLDGVSGLLAGLEPLNELVFRECPELKAIARVGIGLDNVDIPAAEANGVKVSNTPDGPTVAVAEMTLTAALAISRELVIANSALHAGNWRKSIGKGLKDLNVLIIGFGRIGQASAYLFHSMGSNLFICDPIYSQDKLPDGYSLVKIREGLAHADIISLHVSGNERLIGTAEFSLMKKGAVFLNSSRGSLIDEAALISALDAGILAGAWLDVFHEEPYIGPLAGYEQVLLTPHTSTYTSQCRKDMEIAAVKNLLRDLEFSECL